LNRKPKVPTWRPIKNPSGNTVFQIDYIDPVTGKRCRPVGGYTEAEAKREAFKIYSELLETYHGGEKVVIPDITINDLINLYFRNKKGRVADSTLTRYRSLIDHFSNFIDTKMPTITNVVQVKKNYILALLEEMFDAGRKPRTLNATIQQLKSLFKFAIKEGYIINNPAETVNTYRETGRRGRRKFWSESEIELILSNTNIHFRDALEFIYNTGLRKSELLFLTWDDVNQDTTVPYITIQAKDGWNPKSWARDIPLNKRALQLIKSQMATSSSNWVFTAPNGGQIHRDRIYRELKMVLKNLGMVGHVHKLRHSFASNLIHNNVGVEKIKELLGHKHIETTLIYGQNTSKDLQLSVQTLDKKDTKTDNKQ